MSDFGASVGVLSGPGVFPLFICLMVILISLTIVVVIAIGSSECAALMSSRFNVAGLFNSS